jgi:hypothetical protein
VFSCFAPWLGARTPTCSWLIGCHVTLGPLRVLSLTSGGIIPLLEIKYNRSGERCQSP